MKEARVPKFLLVPALMLMMGAAPPEEPAPKVDIERGLKKWRICHGPSFYGKKQTPSLAGMHRVRIHKALGKDGPKKMQPISRGLTDEEKRAIAGYLWKLPPKPENVKPPPKPEKSN